jgi:hypothetical protein
MACLQDELSTPVRRRAHDMGIGMGEDTLQVFWLGMFHVMHAPPRLRVLHIVKATMSCAERSSGVGAAALCASTTRMGRLAMGA